MKITVVGTGYVGLVTAACLAEVGNHVIGLDVDEDKIRRLRRGEVPIHEPGLGDMVQRNLACGRLSFTTRYDEAVKQVEVLFLAVGTPPDEDGSADLSHVLHAAEQAACHLQHDCLVVTKSTVPVGTCERVEKVMREQLALRGKAINIRVASNPEFLREGQAVQDFLKPDRIIVGLEDKEDEAVFRMLYAPFTRNREKLIFVDRRSAELSKYAANAMLAMRISFMNEMAGLCDALGADIECVRKALGMDPRIGPHFLYAGIGYGGSCFPKDVRALLRMGEENRVPLALTEATYAVNQRQRARFIEALLSALQEVDEPCVALWGLAFKPCTDDMREAPSRDVIQALLERGARIKAHDPAAMQVCRSLWPNEARLELMDSPESCLDGADALVLVTEWLCFREPDWEEVERRMRGRLLFDGRNIYDPAYLTKRGWRYHGIGRGRHATVL